MSAAGQPSDPVDIVQTLAGQCIFLTGATGFLGKVLVEKLLWSVPEISKILVLIRPRQGAKTKEGTGSARDRLENEVLESPIMARLQALHGDDWQAWVAGKVEAISGDLAQDRFGLALEEYEELCQRVDRVIGNAATVTFDERIDRSLELNVRGAERSLTLARDAGHVPLLHVSTCFVSGQRSGLIEETVVGEEAIDLDVAVGALEEACTQLKASGKKGDRPWVEAGAAQAKSFGFHDIYTMTKALGERVLAKNQGSVPLAILRPAIVESAALEPFPGWIEAVRVSDPLLVAYGRGRTTEFPGSAETPLELIPVDFVVNALIAALAALPSKLDTAVTEPIPVYQLGSSRNPITLGELMNWARQGFAQTPLLDTVGKPVAPGSASFIEPDRYQESLEVQRRRIRASIRWVPRRRTSPGRLRLGSAERSLDHLIHLLEVYRPYLLPGPRYDDRRTQKLLGRLSPEDQRAFPFDVASLDWSSYVTRVHVPGLVRFALKGESGAPMREPAEKRQEKNEILARAMANATQAETVFELFAATAEAYPDVMALQTFRQGKWLRYTYAQALITTANLAARLAKQYGIGPGDRVILWASGCPEWVLATLAVHRLGAATVPLDPQWPAEEISQAARLVEAKLICAAPGLVESVGSQEALWECPLTALAHPLVPLPEVALLPGVEAVEGVGSSEALASIIFTSGTTVSPKAVPLTHANYLANLRDLVPLMELTRERLLSVLPIHHVFEQMVGLLVPLAGGSTFSYVAQIKPAEISWMMATTKPTVLVAVPRLLELLHNGIRQSVAAGGFKLKLIFRILFALSRRKNGANGHKLFSKVHHRFGGSLRRIASGGSALEPSLGRSFQLMGFAVAEGYGMTETSPVLTVNPWNSIRFGSVGQPLPGVEIDLRLPAEASADLAPGAGEIWVRGANVMAGYYLNPQATSSVMQDGWLNTGDIGFFDDDGYLRLSGRTKDVIVTSAGKNVYPEEVEARYRELPGVAELVILGLPGDGGGERVTALVVPKPGAEEEAIRAAIVTRSKEVPTYQQVSKVEVWRGDLPKTTTMKVKRAVLLERVLSGERGSAGGSSSAPPQSTAGGAAESRTDNEIAVVETLSRLTRTRADLVGAEDRLADLGVDSLTRVELVGELEARFGVRLDDDQAASLDQVQDLFDLCP
ncbi:MAG: AMP-binding protein [Deltaproteobacteria bacterium]|nr:AMP-binding protein [Deltaproteobacteria bacterium]